MADIILHHYPESPFSEKIRALLGYKGVDYKSVIIPMIMPKPDLMPLTGGHRKTPVMQIGADVYCDTAIIAAVIDRLHPDKPVFDASSAAVSGALAHWTDTFFFKVAVQVAFQPKALANNTILSDPEKASAFAADRAELTRGSSELRMDLEVAQPFFLQHLKRLDNQLSRAAFLFGSEPTIGDFSTYHCLWFVHGNEALRDLFRPFEAVSAWLQRMGSLGESRVDEISGADALDVAAASNPVEVEAKVAAMAVDGLQSDDLVAIMPIDYGFDPVRGRLLVASLEELALIRDDARVGTVAVHFPRLGFRVDKIQD